MIRTLASATFVLLLAVSRLSAQSLDTIQVWNGTTFISSFGVPNTATYGQTITVLPGAGALTSFDFEIGNCTAAVDFRAQVFAWDAGNQRATGASLFQSGVITVPANPGVFQLVTINTGALALAPGQYVLMASTSQDQTINNACRWGSVGNNTAYAGGQFVFLNNGTNTAAWTTSQWSFIAEDLAFRAIFAGGVPTMPEWAMFLLAFTLITVAAWVLRMKGRKAASTAVLVAFVALLPLVARAADTAPKRAAASEEKSEKQE
jgi:hypothetical protein